MELLSLREPFSAWSHAFGLLLSVPATALLLRRSRGDRAKQVSLLVFGLSLAICYLGSTLYHGVRLDRDGIRLFDKLDHVGIHVLIAGSYTPLAWNLLRRRWRSGTLIAVWVSNLVGSLLLLADVPIPIPVLTCEYLTLGWGAIFCYFEAARLTSHRALRPLVVGGVLYSVGAVLYVLKWPQVWPGVVGAHGVFHLWVLAGSLAHYQFMMTAVVPFRHVPATEQAHVPPRPRRARGMRATGQGAGRQVPHLGGRLGHWGG